MIKTPPFKIRLILFGILIVILGVLYLVAGRTINYMMVRGEGQAESSMRLLELNLESGDYGSARTKHTASERAVESFRELDRKFGRLTKIRWQRASCSFWGTPCVVEVAGSRSGKPQELWFYFNGKICDGVEVQK